MNNILKNEKAGFFALGVIAATAGVKFLKSKTFRDFCVKTFAKGMRFREEAVCTFTKMKEDAEDLCYDEKLSDDVSES